MRAGKSEAMRLLLEEMERRGCSVERHEGYALVRAAAEADVHELRKALARISLAERDTTSSDHEKVRDMAKIARTALHGPDGGS